MQRCGGCSQTSDGCCCYSGNFFSKTNSPGNKSARLTSATRSGCKASTSKIGICGANSATTCRHAPQGDTPPTEAMASRENCCSPAATAEKIAVRSAQIVKPYEAFSTLQPRNSLSSGVRNAAPTRNFEYGANARRRAANAASTSSRSACDKSAIARNTTGKEDDMLAQRCANES
jgi:hypothetical protein